MTIADVNNYAVYTNYYNTNCKSSSDIEKGQQISKYSSTREYRTYLTEKYDCLKSSDYSVEISSSLLAEAAGDEKTAKWLEYNLSLISETVEKTKTMVEARGSQMLSYNITINGYDSMTGELCTKSEVDPGTEKTRERLEEKIEKIKEEKKTEEKKQEQKRAQEAAEKRQYNIKIDGKNVEEVTRKFIDNVSSSNPQSSTGSNNSTFDVFA